MELKVRYGAISREEFEGIHYMELKGGSRLEEWIVGPTRTNPLHGVERRRGSSFVLRKYAERESITWS